MVRFFVAITDGDWFSHLSQGERPEEVSFCQPTGHAKFHSSSTLVFLPRIERGRRSSWKQELREEADTPS